MKDEIIVRFSKRLKELRKKHGYTQQELAELADVEYKHIQRLESKNPCDVKLTTLNKLAKAFKVSLQKLLDL